MLKRILAILAAVAILLPGLPQAPVAAAGGSVSVRIAASTDDVSRRITATYFNRTTTNNVVGRHDSTDKQWGMGLRFLDIEIPQGATITEAYLKVTAKDSGSYSSTNTPVNTRIVAEGADNPGTFADNAGAFDTRYGTKTTAYVSWQVPAFTTNTEYTSPDIKTVIQEIVDRGGWASGNAIVLFWNDFEDETTGDDRRRFNYSYDDTPAKAPLLTIEWELETRVTTNAATSVASTSATLNGEITALGGDNADYRGFVWDTTSRGDPGDTAPSATLYSNYWTENGDYGAASFNHAITGLSEGTLYYARAAAHNTNGWTYGSEITFLTKPLAPTGFTATRGNTEVVLDWTVGTGADKTYIRGEDGSYPDDRADGYLVYNDSGITVTDTGLTNGHTYYYRAWSYVTAGGLEQYSDNYAQDNATPTEFVAPSVKTNPHWGFGRDWVILSGTITDEGDDTVTSVGFDYGVGSYTDSVTSDYEYDSFIQTINNLTPGTVYQYRAKAYNGAWGYGENRYISTTGSPVVYEYLNTGGDTNSDPIYGQNWAAEYFTVGAESHTVTSVILSLQRTLEPGTVTVSIKHADGDGKPTGNDLTSGTIDGDTLSETYSWYKIDMTEYDLEAGANYAIVVRAVAGNATNYIEWQVDANGAAATYEGFVSTNGGVSWASEDPASYLFEVWGNPCINIVGAKVFSGYYETGDMLIVLNYDNTYVPYYPNETAQSYFDIVLLDPTGTDTIAATTMKAWGYKPGAIYLSANLATSITPGAAYIVGLIGAFGDNPDTYYTLQSTDWRGTDLTLLDNWVINTANTLSTYYGTDLTVYVTGKGEVLNEEGGIIFATGIPGLSVLRPDLFQVAVHIPEYDPSGWDNTFDGITDYEAQIGSTGATFLSTLGTIVGINGQAAGIVLILLVYLLAAGWIVYKGGNATVAILLAIPIALLGVWLRLISMVILGAIAAVIALFFIVSFWWSRT